MRIFDGSTCDQVFPPSDENASLMRLRRTCCHPALVIPKYKGETSKMDKLLELAAQLKRIGQQRPITIYRLIVKETVEEKVVALHAVKKPLVEDILSDTSEAALTPKELLALFK